MQDVQGLNRVYAEQDVEVAHLSALDEAWSLSSQPARPKPKTVAKWRALVRRWDENTLSPQIGDSLVQNVR